MFAVGFACLGFGLLLIWYMYKMDKLSSINHKVEPLKKGEKFFNFLGIILNPIEFINSFFFLIFPFLLVIIGVILIVFRFIK